MTGPARRRLELAIAWRYLRSRRGSRPLSFISVIAIGGMVVGVSALIVIIGVMNGLQHDLREKILVGSPDIRVLNYGSELRIADWRKTLATVARHPGVVAAAPIVLGTAVAGAGNNYTEPVAVAGIVPADTSGPFATSIREKATTGDFTFRSSGGARRGVVLGRLVADRLQATPGVKLQLVTAAGVTRNVVTGAFIPRVYEFEVTGVFETGMYEYDDKYVYMSLSAAQELLGMDSSVTGIEVRADSREAAPALATALEQDLGYPYHTVDWHQQNSSLFKALTLEKLGMSVILSLIILVAAFNIVSTLTMVVRDKTREIGILKAMGLGASSIRRVFLIQGMVIGIVGTGLGLLLGLGTGMAIDRLHLIALDPQIYFIDHLPVSNLPVDVGLISVLGIAIAMVATLYPAVQASRLYPIEAIRSE